MAKKHDGRQPPAYLLDRFYDHILHDKAERRLTKQEFVNKFRREQERKNLLPGERKDKEDE